MHKIYLFLKIIAVLIFSFSAFSIDSENAKNEKGMKSFISLVKYAYQHSPDIKNAASEVSRFTGKKVQSGFFNNPELEVEVENFGGTLPGSTFNSAESTISLSQKFELGGKRKYRKDAANYRVLAAHERYKSVVNQTIFNVFYFYNKTSASFQQLTLAKQMKRLSEDVYNSISEKVKYGKSSPVEKIKASLELERASVKLNRAVYEFEKAEKLLAFAIGAKTTPFELSFYFIADNFQLKGEQEFIKNLRHSPELEEARLLQLSGNKELKLAKSLNIPDITFSVGYRTFRENDDKAYVASASIELPIFNRNKGIIMEKASERESFAGLLKKKEMLVKTAFENNYQEMLILKKKNDQYVNVMLPGARQSYQAVLFGYKSGKFSYLDMLDSMRTLIEVENESIESVFEYSVALGKVLQITGFFGDKLVGIVNEKNEGNERGAK